MGAFRDVAREKMESSPKRGWHAVPGFEGFAEVTRTGKFRVSSRVISVSTGALRRHKSQQTTNRVRNGRLYTSFKVHGKSVTVSIANMVAATFIRPLLRSEIAKPIDGNYLNCHVNNLTIESRRRLKVIKRAKTYLTRERDGEIWKPIPDADGTLLVSNISRVIRTGKHKPVLLAPYRIKGRGASTAINYRNKAGKRVTRSMSKLVLQLFPVADEGQTDALTSGQSAVKKGSKKRPKSA